MYIKNVNEKSEVAVKNHQQMPSALSLSTITWKLVQSNETTLTVELLRLGCSNLKIKAL